MIMFVNWGADSGLFGIHYAVYVVFGPSQGDLCCSWQVCVLRVAMVGFEISPNKYVPELVHVRSLYELYLMHIIRC